MTAEEKALNDWCVKTYLDWVNNYLTLEKMAMNYNMSEKALKSVVDYGRKLFENKN